MEDPICPRTMVGRGYGPRLPADLVLVGVEPWAARTASGCGAAADAVSWITFAQLRDTMIAMEADASKIGSRDRALCDNPEMSCVSPLVMAA
jgi:hypothetical protein